MRFFRFQWEKGCKNLKINLFLRYYFTSFLTIVIQKHLKEGAATITADCQYSQDSFAPGYQWDWPTELSVQCSAVSNTLWPHGLEPTRLLWTWDSLGKTTGVSCYFLLQRIFLAQRSNLSLLFLLKWQVDSLPLCHLGSPAGPIVIRCGHRTVFGYLSVSKGKMFQSETVNYQCLISSSFCPLRLVVEDFFLWKMKMLKEPKPPIDRAPFYS